MNIYVYIYVCDGARECVQHTPTPRQRLTAYICVCGGVRDCVSLKRECVSFRGPLQGSENAYGVATSSRLLEIIGLFCRISSLL